MNKQNTKQIWRQGDVGIVAVARLPKGAQTKKPAGVIAEGEVTGHCHRIEDLALAELLEIEGGLYLSVSEDGVRIVHDEHLPITLPPGNFKIVPQREYSPEGIRNVLD